MRGAILAELPGIGDELGGVDHRRIVLVLVVAVEPGQDHADVVLRRRLELVAGPGRKIDVVGDGRHGAADYCRGKDGRKDSHQCPYSSKRRCAALTMSPNLMISLSMMRTKSSGGPPPGLAARFLSLADTPGSRMAWLRLFSSLATTGAGAAAGANTPLHR